MTRPYISGFCTPGNPAESHRRCPGTWSSGPDCTCACHTPPAPEQQQEEAPVSSLTLSPITEIKALVDLLADMGLDPLHLNIDARSNLDRRPRINLWMRYRTDFETFCARIGAKPAEKRYTGGTGQREWHANSDTPARALLVQCVSFDHHPDWQPREDTK